MTAFQVSLTIQTKFIILKAKFINKLIFHLVKVPRFMSEMSQERVVYR